MQLQAKRIFCIYVVGMSLINTNFAFGANSKNRPASPEQDSRKKDNKNSKEKDSVSGQDEKASVKSEKSALNMKTKAAAPSGNRRWGAGLDLGSNATYGNALVASFNPIDFLNIQGGLGYNTTGLKMGVGSAAVLPLGRFGFDFGGALVHSNGIKDKVSLPAKFTPEGSSTDENVTVTKSFTSTPANYLSGFGGFFFDLVPAFRILAHVNFNKVLSGNEVKFDGQAQYDASVDASNESEVESDFDPKAKKKLDISGLGFSIGLQYRF